MVFGGRGGRVGGALGMLIATRLEITSRSFQRTELEYITLNEIGRASCRERV